MPDDYTPLLDLSFGLRSTLSYKLGLPSIRRSFDLFSRASHIGSHLKSQQAYSPSFASYLFQKQPGSVVALALLSFKPCLYRPVVLGDLAPLLLGLI